MKAGIMIIGELAFTPPFIRIIGLSHKVCFADEVGCGVTGILVFAFESVGDDLPVL